MWWAAADLQDTGTLLHLYLSLKSIGRLRETPCKKPMTGARDTPPPFQVYLSLKSIGRLRETLCKKPYGTQLDQRATTPIAGPPCARAPAHTVLRPRRLRHHLGKIDVSIISLTSKTRSSGRRQYLLLATLSQFCGDLCARPTGAATPTCVRSYRSPGPPTPQPLKTGSHKVPIDCDRTTR